MPEVILNEPGIRALIGEGEVNGFAADLVLSGYWCDEARLVAEVMMS